MTYPEKYKFGFLLLCIQFLHSFPSYASDMEQNNWAKDAIFYAVYVRSFLDSDNDGHGDLNGLTSKLDYINSLGANALLLMPIHDNDHDIHGGYATIDYYNVEKSYGGNVAWQTFINEAHSRNIKVILDLSLTHVADSHNWFTSAKHSKLSNERNYFLWSDAPCPKNQNVFNGPAWTQIDDGTCYYSTYDPSVPTLNAFNPELAEKLHSVGRYWLEQGADGYRLDSAPHMAELNPATPLQPSPSSTHTHGFWRDFISHLKTTKSSSITVAEIFSPDIKVVTPFYKDGIDMVFDYPLYLTLIDAWLTESGSNLSKSIESTVASRPAGKLGAIFLGNHDVPGEIFSPHGRISDFFSGNKKRLTSAAMLLFSLPGTPFIYYGDEIGLAGAPPPREGKPLWSRNPMQWNLGDNRGFSSHKPWTPLSENSSNVASQDNISDSLLETYRGLIKTRKLSPALTKGNYQTIETNDPSILTFIRQYEREIVLIAINLSGENKKTTCNLQEIGINHAKASDQIFSLPYPDVNAENASAYTLILPAYEGRWIKLVI